MKSSMMAPAGGAEEESEFFPPSVLLVTAALIVALMQLSGGPTNVINRQASTISPFSFIALSKGLVATLRAIQLTTITGGGSLTAKLFAGFFPISYLGFSWLPRILGHSQITPAQIGMKLSDFFGDPSSLHLLSFPTLDYLSRFVFHPFYVSPLKTASFPSAFYWIAFIPASFYLVFSLLDGEFIGARPNTSNPSTTSPASRLTQIISNVVLVIIANLFCISTALHFSHQFSIFELPIANTFYGPEPLLFSLFILLLYRNPVVYSVSLSSPSLQLPFLIETRWIVSVLLLLLLGVTPWKNVPIILMSGGMAGFMLVIKEWVQNQQQQQQRSTDNSTLSRFQKFQYFVLVLELSIYYVSFFLLPLSTISTPSLKSLVSLNLSNFIQQFSSGSSPLWNVLCSTDAVARFLSKILALYLPLLPIIPAAGYASSCRSLAVLFCLQLFYAMNSRIWVFPHIGFLIHAIGAYRLFVVIPSLKEE